MTKYPGHLGGNYFCRERLKLFSAAAFFSFAAPSQSGVPVRQKDILIKSVFDHHWMGAAAKAEISSHFRRKTTAAPAREQNALGEDL